MVRKGTDMNRKNRRIATAVLCFIIIAAMVLAVILPMIA